MPLRPFHIERPDPDIGCIPRYTGPDRHYRRFRPPRSGSRRRRKRLHPFQAVSLRTPVRRGPRPAAVYLLPAGRCRRHKPANRPSALPRLSAVPARHRSMSVRFGLWPLRIRFCRRPALSRLRPESPPCGVFPARSGSIRPEPRRRRSAFRNHHRRR